MRLAFGDITKEVNVFNLRKQQRDFEDQTFEVNYIGNLISEHEELENEFELEDFNLDEIVDSAVDWALNPIMSTPETEFANLSGESLPSLELKVLSEHLKYASLSENDTLSVITTSHLTGEQEESLMSVLRKEKEAIRWTMSDIKAISPAIVQHHIHLNDDATPKRDPQCRLNPIMQDAVKTKILKLLNNGIIYSMSDSQWVSPVHIVSKKAGFTVVENKNKEFTNTITNKNACLHRLSEIKRCHS